MPVETLLCNILYTLALKTFCEVIGMKVLITPRSFSKSGADAVKLLKEKGYEVVENKTGKTYLRETMINLCKDADGVIVGTDTMDEEVLRGSVKLKAISKYGAGVDNIDLKTAESLGIKVRRAAGANATSVAELAVGMFFAIARNIVSSAAAVKNGKWEKASGTGITGKSLGIIGLGCIGREVARMAFGLGMNIYGYDPYFNDNEFAQKYGIKTAGLDDLFSASDFITLHLPLTDETKYIVNEKTLGLMKKTAFLINTARGELVDEDALYEALYKGTIAGAAQDVFSKEPPEVNDRFLKLNNFILTPHIGASTQEAVDKMIEISTKNLIEMLEEK